MPEWTQTIRHGQLMQDFSSWYLQVISMDINKLTARAVLNGQRAAAVAVVHGGGCGRDVRLFVCVFVWFTVFQ